MYKFILKSLLITVSLHTAHLKAESLEQFEAVASGTSTLVCKVSDKSFTIYKENNTTNNFFAIIRAGYWGRDVLVDAFYRTEGSGECRYSVWDFEYQGVSIVLDQYSIKTGCWGERLPPEVGTLRIGGPEGVALLCEEK